MCVLQEKKILKLDVDAVLRDKMPRYYRYVPKWIVRWLARTVCQDGLNDLLERHGDKRGVEFAKAIIDDLNITLKVEGLENVPKTERLIFASNHPLGALDGIALISLLGDMYPGKLKFLVNDILMAIYPFSDIFLPINKHGKQSRNDVARINDAFAGNDTIATFPAGLCSRNLHGSHIEDLAWQKGFVAKSIEYHRDIVPIHFEGLNSSFFYRLGKIRRRLCVKINIEMIYLPSEIFKSRGKEYTIRFGSPISWQKLDDSRSHSQWADEIKKRTYDLVNNKTDKRN